jgi:hypothetical protein
MPDSVLKANRVVPQGASMGEASKSSTQGNEHPSTRRVHFQGTRKPISGALIDLEWARVYAGGIQVELKLIAADIADLNLHVSSPELIKGAALLRAQMKRASKQVGEMRHVSSLFEGPGRKPEEKGAHQVSGSGHSAPRGSKKRAPAEKNFRSGG